MKVQELEKRLLDEGCNPGAFNTGPRCIVTDIDCLDQVDGVWQVFFTERGRDDAGCATVPTDHIVTRHGGNPTIREGAAH